MSLPDYILDSIKKRKLVTQPYSTQKLYFALLPTELLILLMLYFNSYELLVILPQLELLPEFLPIFSSSIFWRKIWRRDISSFVDPPDNAYEKYIEIFIQLNSLSRVTKFVYIPYLASNGYDILLKPLLVGSRENYDIAMKEAAQGGHIKLVDYTLTKGANNYNQTMSEAARDGHIDIVKLMIQNGATDYNQALVSAARGGHVDIVKLMLKKGANAYNRALTQGALYNVNIDIVNLLIEKGANDYNGALINGAFSGNFAVVKLMLEKGADAYRQAMINAMANNHIDIVNLLKLYQ